MKIMTRQEMRRYDRYCKFEDEINERASSQYI